MYLQTTRLIIRNFDDKDLETFLAYRNDPDVARYQGWGLPYSREKGEALIASMKSDSTLLLDGWSQFAVALKETDELIGDLGCRIKRDDPRQARIGFSLASRYWRKGFITEAAAGLLRRLFEELNMHRVTADCDVENIASYRTLEKLGFRREAHFVESFLVDGIYTSEYHYAMLQSEWRDRLKGG
ncbi:MAG: GNAT family N-acetyltransferase [Chloroflexi bacterium]|nr:GNAT family N-acetyltransferase [Chloroflexota bacterium]